MLKHFLEEERGELDLGNTIQKDEAFLLMLLFMFRCYYDDDFAFEKLNDKTEMAP